MTKKVFIDPNDIDLSILKGIVRIALGGGIVAIPTETVYGLAICAGNTEAINRLYEIKNRPQQKLFSYAVSDASSVVEKYFDTLTPFGYRLMEKFWPGPLTVIYYSADNKKIGVRVPAHPVAQKFIELVGQKVFLPSANISGSPEKISADEVGLEFGDKIDVIIDSGAPAYGKPSTVVDLTLHPFKILREGVISEKEIIDIFVVKRILFVCTGNTCRSPMAHLIFKKYLDEKEPYLKERYEVISGGVSAFDGSPVSSQVASILKEKEDIDVRGFRAKKIDRLDVLSSDLIFTMEEEQTKYILKIEPTVEGRIFHLKKFLSHSFSGDIPDPIGKSYEVYENAYFLIKQAVLELRDWL
ncbi:MAG: L-threonylcarbamoyladenylate synthase [Candidatus Omnitrophica bacterium]|nr:L-threonylcarbamoyladenylate synthase [Candidatus Omnitrophota bacterium]